MSREINNREYRHIIIRELLAELHEGKSVDEVKAKFEKAFDGVSASEISEAEQILIEGGMPVEEVQRLCDVHAAVFKDALQSEAPPQDISLIPGHPVHTMIEENRKLEHLIENEIKSALLLWQNDDNALLRLKSAIEKLSNISIHYLRKENLLFPYMEKHGITAPPKVMWGVDDEIRGLIKQTIESVQEPNPDKSKLKEKIDEVISKITEMIFKEENIMIPMLIESLSPSEWKRIADESSEIGYFLIPTPPVWAPSALETENMGKDLFSDSGNIVLPTGVLKFAELAYMLDSLPIDITFVDNNDTVKYFSRSAERVFPRTKAIIGRNVANCHPPASVHIVEGILSDFKSGRKTHEDFWIKMKDKYIYIRYFAVRDDKGEYLGTLEVTQDIAPIKQITGEKRLVEK